MGRTAIVTGGASGIGRALATAVVARDAHVVVADIDSEQADLVAKELDAGGPGSAEAAALDVRDADAVQRLVEDVHDRHGLDFLFNNAGIGFGARPEELTLAHWERTIDVNLRGVIHGCHAAYPLMLEQGHGHLINTASVAGVVPNGLMPTYTTTKYAVVGLSLAFRSAATDTGVTVHAVCPSWVETPILDSQPPADLPPLPSAGLVEIPEVIDLMGVRVYDPDRLAADVLRGIARDDDLIVAPRTGRALWRLHRYAPWASRALDRRLSRKVNELMNRRAPTR